MFLRQLCQYPVELSPARLLEEHLGIVINNKEKGIVHLNRTGGRGSVGLWGWVRPALGVRRV